MNYSQEREGSCSKRHCRYAAGEGTWTTLCEPQGVPRGVPVPHKGKCAEECITVLTCMQNIRAAALATLSYCSMVWSLYWTSVRLGWQHSRLGTGMEIIGTIPLPTFWFRWTQQSLFLGEERKDQGNHFKKPIIFAAFVQSRNVVQNIQLRLAPVASTKEAFNLICETHNQLTQCNSSHQFEEKKFCWKHRQVAVSIFH